MYQDDTHSLRLADVRAAGVAAPMLTVLWHPDPARLGAQCAVPVDAAQPLALNRFAPAFLEIGGTDGRPLEHPGISRTPIHLDARSDGSVRLLLPLGASQNEVDGVPASGDLVLEPARVGAGVILTLRGRVTLCLRHREALPDVASRSLRGVSADMIRVRRQVALAASTDMPVLVLGESGTGKELVAQAIHALGRRAGRPLVAVNMATLSESLALAELFGNTRGAFTGAQAARRGLWAEANGGTLFLDEVGDTPGGVQPMLLRAMETGQYRPLGSNRVETADVRLIAATDRALDEGGFNMPLLRRMEAFVVRMPPLRERREDIGPLLHSRLALPRGAPDWLGAVPPELVRALCLYEWPGNVRQFGHALQRLVLASGDRLWPSVAELLGLPSGARPLKELDAVAPLPMAPAPASAAPTARARRLPSAVTGEELVDALEQCAWSLRATASHLQVSRTSLYALIDRHPAIRWPQDIAPEEIAAAIGTHGPLDVASLASRLRTPREALRRRLAALGLEARTPLADGGDVGGSAGPL